MWHVSRGILAVKTSEFMPNKICINFSTVSIHVAYSDGIIGIKKLVRKSQGHLWRDDLMKFFRFVFLKYVLVVSEWELFITLTPVILFDYDKRKNY